MSHPTMGAWIEIQKKDRLHCRKTQSHPTMGAWIEIPDTYALLLKSPGRTPRWVRGLKYLRQIL